MEKDNTAILWLENTRPTVLLYQAPEYDSKMNSVAKQHPNKIDMTTMISFESLEKGLMRNSGSSMRPGKFKTALFSMVGPVVDTSYAGSNRPQFRGPLKNDL